MLDEVAPPKPLRRRLYEELEPRARRGSGLSILNRLLVGLILFATLIAILETETEVVSRAATFFSIAEAGLGYIFLIEYAARAWVAPERRPERSALSERLRFFFSPAAILDLIVIASSFAFVGGTSTLLLRWLRLARIVRLAKLGRMSLALDHMIDAIHSRRHELALSMLAGLALMVTAATALYFAEGTVQPEKFGSIPRALWWSVATLTTIGYGDVYPITPLGKVLASITALLSIGLIAMPTGILAAAFSDGMERHRRQIGPSRQEQETNS